MVALLFQRKRRVVGALALSVLVGIVAAGINLGAVSLLPPRITASNLSVSAATANVLVDTPTQSQLQRRTLPQDLTTMIKHTELAGRTMVSDPVVERIAAKAGVPRGELAGVGRLTAFVPDALTEPGSEQRASEIEWSLHPYRLEVQASPSTAILSIYAQAPTTEQAVAIADAAVPALREYLVALGEEQQVPESRLVQLRQLGGARGGIVNGGAAPAIAVLTFLVAFGLTFAGICGVLWLRHRPLSPPEQPARAQVAPDSGPGLGDWPRTTRVLPWLLAFFIVLLWLAPIDSITLAASVPIDLKGDRLVLPFIFGLWVFALAAGGRGAPRIRITLIHAALAVFLACAFLSVVLNARYLNQSLELDLSLKKLPLIASYVSLFFIVASAVRYGEVAPFLKLSLGCAVILALGMIWEYRFKQNLFYAWSDTLLPGAFTVVQDSPLEVDHLGRRLVRGSAGVPLEAVTMLSLALPIALVGLLRSERRGQILYGLAACALVAAMFATYRKSALLAPVSVILTVAYFRRRELLKLAPLGMVLVVLVTVLSPGALGTIVSQFTRSDAATVPTVSDRTSDYDAVRPDVWTNLAFGRGWGSYNHVDYRILDSEILQRTIETGVLGLVAFLLVAVSVILVARRLIASRHRYTAPVGLVGAAGAVSLVVAATLYDVLSYPHSPYIFLYIAGLVAVVSRGPDPRPGRLPAEPDAQHAGRRRPRRPLQRAINTRVR